MIPRLAHANETGKAKAGGSRMQSGKNKQMQELGQLGIARSSAREGITWARNNEHSSEKQNKSEYLKREWIRHFYMG